MDTEDKAGSATIYLRVAPALKHSLKQIALDWERQRGTRVTINDVGIEALEAFVRHQDAQAGPQAQQGQEAAPQPLSAAGRAKRVADQGGASDEPAF